MNNKYLTIGAAVVLVAGVGFFILNKNDSKTVKNAFINNLSINKGVKCTQTSPVGEDGNSITSTLYFYKNKMRYDTELSKEVQNQKDMHSIKDGEYTYIWGKSAAGNMFGGANRGFKIKNDEEDNNYTPDIDANELEQSNFSAPYLKCEKWSPDNSLFELPKNIDFMSMSEMMNPANINVENQTNDVQNKTTTDSNTNDMCAMCDMIPDTTAKEECKKSCKNQ